MEAMPRESNNADEDSVGRGLPALREEPRQSDILTLSDMYSNLGDISQTEDTMGEDLHILEPSHLLRQTTEPVSTTTDSVQMTLADIIVENTASPQTITEIITTSNTAWEPEDVTSLTEITDGKTTMMPLSTAGMTMEETVTVRNPTTASKTSTKKSHATTTTRTTTIETTLLPSTSTVAAPRTETWGTSTASVNVIAQRQTSPTLLIIETSVRPESRSDTTKFEPRTIKPTTR